MNNRPYGGLDPTERRAARRRRLLDAALELFGVEGFRQTTIPKLCRTATVTTVHFYQEFGSLEALLEAVYVEIAEAVFALVQSELTRTERTREQRIRAAHDAYYGFLTSDERRARVYAVEVMGVSPAFERRRRLHHAAFVDQGARATGDGAFRPVPSRASRMLSASLTGAALALLTDWIFADERAPVAALSEHITMLWTSALDAASVKR